MLQFPGATGRVKLVDELEVNEQHLTALLVVLSHSVAVVDVSLCNPNDYSASSC